MSTKEPFMSAKEPNFPATQQAFACLLRIRFLSQISYAFSQKSLVCPSERALHVPQKSHECPQKSPIFPQHSKPKKAIHPGERVVYVFKRALYVRKRALYVRKRALFPRNRARLRRSSPLSPPFKNAMSVSRFCAIFRALLRKKWGSSVSRKRARHNPQNISAYISDFLYVYISDFLYVSRQRVALGTLARVGSAFSQ